MKESEKDFLIQDVEPRSGHEGGEGGQRGDGDEGGELGEGGPYGQGRELQPRKEEREAGLVNEALVWIVVGSLAALLVLVGLLYNLRRRAKGAKSIELGSEVGSELGEQEEEEGGSSSGSVHKYGHVDSSEEDEEEEEDKKVVKEDRKGTESDPLKPVSQQ